MLYRTLKRLLERGRTDAMEQKLETFLATSKLSEPEYAELSELLPSKNT